MSELVEVSQLVLGFSPLVSLLLRRARGAL